MDYFYRDVYTIIKMYIVCQHNFISVFKSWQTVLFTDQKSRIKRRDVSLQYCTTDLISPLPPYTVNSRKDTYEDHSYEKNSDLFMTLTITRFNNKEDNRWNLNLIEL